MKIPNTKRLTLLLSTCFLLIFISCEYEFVEVDQPDLNIPVKFTENILPIFEAHKCIACHHSNYTIIDFSDEKAYNTIVPKLIDTLQPELSKIYFYPNPASSKHQFKKYTPAEAALVLNWIIQGAENN